MRLLFILSLAALTGCQITQADLDNLRAQILYESEDGLTEDELDRALDPLQQKVDRNEEMVEDAKDSIPQPVASVVALVTALAGAYGIAKKQTNELDKRREERRRLRGERTSTLEA